MTTKLSTMPVPRGLELALVQAMAESIEDSINMEDAIRQLLVKTGHNDPNITVVECVGHLVKAYFRLNGGC